MTRLAVLAAALLCAAAASVADSQLAAGDPRSAVERHWLAYAEMQRQKDLRPH